MYKLIVAATITGGIGFEGTIPWHNPEDLRHFKNVTVGNTVVMGRKTFESLPKVLPNRLTIVMTSSEMEETETVKIANCIEDVFRIYESHKKGYLFICGGSQVYSLFQNLGLVHEYYVTTILDNPQCDTFYSFPKGFHEKVISRYSIEGGFITRYAVRNKEELAWLNVLRRLLNAPECESRAGPVRKLWGVTLRYNLLTEEEGWSKLPMNTTRYTPVKGVFTELMWFISGSTDSKKLVKMGSRIWEGNSSREFLDSRGLTEFREGDIGATYGYQWRHAGEEYKGCDTEYRGIDQLKDLIEQIKSDPFSRRHILTSWSVPDLDKMSLPPCLHTYQFDVTEGFHLGKQVRFLDCMAMQRSSDFALASNWNALTASFLTLMIAQQTGCVAREVVHVIGNCHLYETHWDTAEEQSRRNPYPYPAVKLERRDNIEDYTFDDVTIAGYTSYGKLKYPMAV